MTSWPQSSGSVAELSPCNPNVNRNFRVRTLGMRMHAFDLVQNLTFNKMTTGYGTPYVPNGRGIFRMLTALYAWLVKQGRQFEADAVATAFTKQDGTHAWE